MMNNDDVPRGMQYQQGRKPPPPKYQDSRYSPSANYNYNTNGNYAPQQQYPRRRIERFRKENVNYSDRLTRQNDLIIRLLKEIRDRLPPPPVAAAAVDPGNAEAARHGGTGGEAERTEARHIERSASVPETAGAVMKENPGNERSPAGPQPEPEGNRNAE